VDYTVSLPGTMLKCLLLVGVVLLRPRNVSSQDSYQIRAVELHNEYRSLHGAPPLILDEHLCYLAQLCAQYYAHKRTKDHTCPHKGFLGESIVAGENGDWTAIDIVESGTKLWYDEGRLYDYNNPGLFHETAEFTQLVWVSSEGFCFAVASRNGFTVGVGLYNPPGNLFGQFLVNVLPPAAPLPIIV